MLRYVEDLLTLKFSKISALRDRKRLETSRIRYRRVFLGNFSTVPIDGRSMERLDKQRDSKAARKKSDSGKRRKRNAILSPSIALESTAIRSRPDSRGAKIEREKFGRSMGEEGRNRGTCEPVVDRVEERQSKGGGKRRR